MWGSAKAQRPSVRQAYADFESTAAAADWRSQVWWPVSIEETNRIGQGQVRRTLAFAAARGDELARDAVLLALPNILGYARAIVPAALATALGASQGYRLLGAAPEFAYLENGESDVPVRASPILAHVHPRFMLARRLARLATWTPGWRLPKALLAPDAIAINHNELLIAAARRSGKTIGFQHAQAIFDEAGSDRAAPDVTELADELALAVLGDDVVEEPYRSRAIELLRALARAHVRRAINAMQVLRNASLPQELWSGSGGLYGARAAGLEVLHRGGRVMRFNHGTPMSFIEAREIQALLEMSVSSDVTLATEEAAALWRQQCDESLHRWRGAVGIHCLDGDPVFARVPRQRPPRSGGRKLRVVYAPTQLLGFRQLLPAQPTDVIYLDWQMRVAEALRRLPVDLVCQAHPEGLLQHQAHPLEQIAPTRRGNFAAQFESADVFVFDYAMTTALWETACTDARIVFLDIGSGSMTPEIASLFGQRAHVTKVPHDDANRPVLDEAALADAVMTEGGSADPMPLRRLLAGVQP